VVAALVMLGIAFFGDRAHTGYMAVASLVVYVAFFALGTYHIVERSVAGRPAASCVCTGSSSEGGARQGWDPSHGW
jgi:hypothetical protein